MKVAEFNPDCRDTIIFLHGSNVAGWMWGQQIPAFNDFHLLVPDLPGFGDSNHLPWVSVADTANQLARLIGERAHDGRAHVVGLSLGSSVALDLAFRHPSNTQTAFLASAIITKPTALQRVLSKVMLSCWNQRWFWTGLAKSYRLPPEDTDLFVTTGLGISKQTAQRIFEEISTPRTYAEPLTPPILVVAGGRDSTSIKATSLQLFRDIPGVTTALAPGMHHAWNVENVEMFNAAVREWIVSRTVSTELR